MGQIILYYYSTHILGTWTFLNKCGETTKLSSYFKSDDCVSELNNILLTASLYCSIDSQTA
ncbi:MAG: hypothetical protein ACM3XP_07495 [Nitrososphaerales archaeon]